MGYDSHMCSCMKVVKVPQWRSDSYYFALWSPPPFFLSFSHLPINRLHTMYNVQSESFQAGQNMILWQTAHNSSARLRYSRIWGVISCWLQLPIMCHCKIMTCGVWLCVVPSVTCAPSANGTLYGKNTCIKFYFKLHKTVNETFHVSKKQSISL